MVRSVPDSHNTIIWKVLTFITMIATEPWVYVATITTGISYLCSDLEDTINHLKSFKLNSYPVDNVQYLFAEILVNSDHLESARAFNPEYLGYITCIFEDTYDSRFLMWAIQKYKEVTDFIRNFVCVTWISYHRRFS